jgi:hypothetical protein
VIAPLLAKIQHRVPHPGRKRHPDLLVFQGVLFVLHTGIASGEAADINGPAVS